MSQIDEQEPQLEFVYVPPFSQMLDEGPGRWFTTEHGVVWTNDDDGLGFIPSDNTNAQIEQLESRKSLADAGHDASSAFEELLDQERDNNPGVEVVTDNLSALLAPPTTEDDLVDQDEYGVTLDDEGNVLELVKTNADGVFIYDSDQWVALDPDAEENDDDTVYGREWIDVSPDIVGFFMQHFGDDTITRDQIESFIL